VTTGQNGPGTSDVEEITHDPYGRPIWTKDGAGFLGYTAYDAPTGAITKTITDVDTTLTGDFQNLPPLWSTPAGGGLHLLTQFVVDKLGRTTKRTDPRDKAPTDNTHQNVTYLTYDDVAHEVRTYPGWLPTGRPTGPTQLWREDRGLSPSSYVETLTMDVTPTLNGNGEPLGTEAIANVQTLTRTFTSKGGRVERLDVHPNSSGVPYSKPVAQPATETTNYSAPLYGYDKRGRRNKVQLPIAGQFGTRTIHYTDYDGL